VDILSAGEPSREYHVDMAETWQTGEISKGEVRWDRTPNFFSLKKMLLKIPGCPTASRGFVF
jgi:hypothetical protein